VNSPQILQILRNALPAPPTADQSRALEALSSYLLEDSSQRLFILKGYAGTGKTTLMRALARSASSLGLKAVLAAPTGRAAKVLQGQLQRRAYTLHRMLYLTVRSPEGGFKRIKRENKVKRGLFIVDEASMLGDSGESGHLLEDLLQFVHQGTDCRLLLVGDEAQLPPVGQTFSPALQPKYLRDGYGWKIRGAALQEVMRQAADSGILNNATVLRSALGMNEPKFPRLRVAEDVQRLADAHEVFEAMERAFASQENDSVVITRSNKRAVAYNRQIRGRLLWREEIINAGDKVMVVQNNERWMDPDDPVGFVANGDQFEVLSWRNEEERYGLRFADATLRWLDRDQAPNLEAKILLDVLDSETPRLAEIDLKRMQQEVYQEAEELPKTKRAAYIHEHDYLQALQLKFAYALTGHKSQGGQWAHVFVEWPFTEDTGDPDFLRWMYTAVTRAQEQLYLIGFPEATFAPSDDPSLL